MLSMETIVEDYREYRFHAKAQSKIAKHTMEYAPVKFALRLCISNPSLVSNCGFETSSGRVLGVTIEIV